MTGHKSLFLLTAFVLFSSSDLPAKDLGMFYGEPTPALAMLAAQTKFADEKCIAEGFVTNMTSAAKLKRMYKNLLATEIYKKKDEEYAANLDAMYDKYDSAWGMASQESRAAFCDGYKSDMAKRDDGFIRWATPIQYMKAKLSPLTEEARNRQQKWAAIASVAGVVATSAASISAGNDALSSARAGNWNTSNAQMALSRDFIDVGSYFADNSALSASNAISSELVSVLEVTGADGATRIVRCPVIDHFYRYSAPIDSPIWMTYQTASVDCRDPTPADLERMQAQFRADLQGSGNTGDVEAAVQESVQHTVQGAASE